MHSPWKYIIFLCGKNQKDFLLLLWERSYMRCSMISKNKADCWCKFCSCECTFHTFRLRQEEDSWRNRRRLYRSIRLCTGTMQADWEFGNLWFHCNQRRCICRLCNQHIKYCILYMLVILIRIDQCRIGNLRLRGICGISRDKLEYGWRKKYLWGKLLPCWRAGKASFRKIACAAAVGARFAL